MIFQNYVDRCLVKAESKIKRVCAPLKERLDIPLFAYYYLDSEGRYCNLANSIQDVEHYYHLHLYSRDSYNRHPRFYQSGCSVIQLTYDDHLQQEFKEKLKINKLFQILNKYDTYMEGFLFARRDKESIDYLHFFDQMYYLRKFGLYFKLEMKSEIHRILDFEYNMRAALGDQFDTPSVSLPCLGIERKYEQFLQEIDPLSQQENRCINLYKQGHSAQATAAKMGLSQRTVEHYLDNARLKLGLRSKRELLEF